MRGRVIRPSMWRDRGTIVRGNLVPDYGSGYVSVLVAVMAMDRPTITDIAAEVGFMRSTVHAHLEQLRRDGFVDWVAGHKGTLHATCQIVRVNHGTP